MTFKSIFTKRRVLIAFGLTAWMFILWRGIPIAESIIHGKFFIGEHIRPLSLLAAVLLIPINLGLETTKWFLLVRSDLTGGFWQAFRTVLGGLALGIITPNRIGEPFTRSMLLKSESYVSTTAAALLCSLAQQITTLMFGIIGMLMLLSFHRIPITTISYNSTLALSLGLAAGLVILMMLFPSIMKKVAGMAIMRRVKQSFRSLSLFGAVATAKITGLSMARYLVFSGQYLLLLYGFGANISIPVTVSAIASIYLVGSAIPSMAIADIGVRISLALLFLGPIVGDEAAVTASSLLWMVNVGIPAALGGLLLILKKGTITIPKFQNKVA